MTPGSNPDAPHRAILFVCLGNICRSPLAEGVFLHLARERGVAHRLQVDSAGTGGWHVGNPPDPRAQAVARENGVILGSRARQVDPGDAEAFDLILAMDRANLADLRRHLPPGGRAELRLFRDFDPTASPEDEAEVPDPYYGGPEGFQEVYEMVHRSCEALLDHLGLEGEDRE
jgi:protein-tyrosine phosphatase